MENQNEQAFEAEQDVNAFVGLRPRSVLSRRSLVQGRNGSQQNMEDDRAPLLGGDRDEAPTWDGERDFEGEPWWKTPSVGASLRLSKLCL